MIGKYLKIFRTCAGRKSGEFAGILGASPPYYSLVENGHKTPLRATLHKWAGRLGISAGAIDFLALGAPRELSREDLETFERLKGALVNDLVFKFLATSPAPIKEVGGK